MRIENRKRCCDCGNSFESPLSSELICKFTRPNQNHSPGVNSHTLLRTRSFIGRNFLSPKEGLNLVGYVYPETRYEYQVFCLLDCDWSWWNEERCEKAVRLQNLLSEYHQSIKNSGIYFENTTSLIKKVRNFSVFRKWGDSFERLRSDIPVGQGAVDKVLPEHREVAAKVFADFTIFLKIANLSKLFFKEVYPRDIDIINIVSACSPHFGMDIVNELKKGGVYGDL